MMRCFDVAFKSNLPEDGLHRLAFDMPFYIAAVYCHRHDTQRLLIGVPRTGCSRELQRAAVKRV